MTKQPKLYPARCPRCRQVLAYAPAGAEAHCPTCRMWTLARPDTAELVTRRTAPIRETRAAIRQEFVQMTLF